MVGLLRRVAARGTYIGARVPSATAPSKRRDDLRAGDYVTVILAWLIPGSGHYLLGQRQRGIIFAVALHALFLGGVFLGGLRVLSPPRQPIWGYTQYVAGWPMIIGTELKNRLIGSHAPLPVGTSPKIQDVGTVYCGLAGMLNLLVIFDVLVRISNGETAEAAAARDVGLTAAQKGET